MRLGHLLTLLQQKTNSSPDITVVQHNSGTWTKMAVLGSIKSFKRDRMSFLNIFQSIHWQKSV